MKILGIDPGLSGGLAFQIDGQLFVYATPTIKTEFIKNGKKKTRRYMDMDQVVFLIRQHGADKAYIEKVSAMKGQGVTGMFRFGQNFGQWQGILTAMGIPYTEVRPQLWKKEFDLTSDKSGALTLAREMFPANLSNFKLKKHDGLAEASLIREFGKRAEQKSVQLTETEENDDED